MHAAADQARGGKKSGSATRRMGVPGSKTWTLLLDTAEQMLLEKGYGSITSRQLGAKAKLSPHIVYFYFRTMDDLFEGLFKRLADGFLDAIEMVSKAPAPLLALWEMSSDPSRAVLMSELISLSHHRKGLQALISEFGVEYNRRQSQIIEAALAASGIDFNRWPPTVLASILENLAKGLAFGVGFDIPSHNLARDRIATFIKELASR